MGEITWISLGFWPAREGVFPCFFSFPFFFLSLGRSGMGNSASKTD